MSTHAARPRRDLRNERSPGPTLAIASVLMLPALVVSYVVAALVGFAVQDALGLDEGDLLSEAGVRGWIAASFLLLLLVLPPIAGVVLGVAARRRGERRLATAAVVLNAGLASYLLVSVVLQLILA